MSDQNKRLRGVRVTKKHGSRADNYELWVNEPLQLAIQHALNAREWTISDLARAIHSQPSLVSRWMMGSRPSVASLLAVSQALALDIKHLLMLAEYLPPEAVSPIDERKEMLKAKIDELELDDRLFTMLNGVLEVARKEGLPAPHPTPKPRKPSARPRTDRADQEEERRTA